MVMALSDQQLVTGLAILIAAYVKLSLWNDISVYHFTITMDLAWFSSNTHLFSLIVLREWLRGRELMQPVTLRSGKEGFPAMRVFVSLFMVTIAIGLIAGSVIQSYQYWYSAYTCQLQYAILDLPNNIGGDQRVWTIVNIVLISYSYPRTILPLLFNGLDDICQDQIDKRPTRASPPREWLRNWYKWIFVVDQSLVWGLVEQFVWYGIGCWSLISDVMEGRVALDDNSEAQWGFGQTVPVMLLLLPFLSAWEAYHGKLSTLPTSLAI
jgi:hypothetical protein